MATVSFQQGVSGYTGTLDTMIQQATPTVAYGTRTKLGPDTGTNANVQTLLTFDNIFGTGPGQIPLGATITSATLTLQTTNGSDQGASLHRMLTNWMGAPTWTWDSFNNGIQFDDTEAVREADVSTGAVVVGSRDLDVTNSLQAWSDGAANYGWVFMAGGTDGWDFYSAQGATKPMLTVTYTTDGEPDTTSPTVAMNSPTEGATISGLISLSAAASDNIGVRGVQFRLDSENVGSLDTTAPYTVNLDTTTVSNGTVALSAVATDLSGNQAVSSPITVTIDNGSTPPPPPPPPPSGTLRVPEDYATIQDAVNAAGNGDTILVGPGTYAGGIIISGKTITLTSHYQVSGDQSLVNQTIISGGDPAVTIAASAPNTIVKGFHFVGGIDAVQFFAQGGQALDNFFDDTVNDALSFENVGGIARGNHFFSPGDDGVDVDDARGNVLIENNAFEFARDDGIEIRNQNYSGPHVTLTVRNNTIVGSGEDGIQLIDYSANSNRTFVIERNLIRTSTDAGLGLMDNGETLEDFRAASMPERVHVFNNTFDGNTYGITGGDNLVAVNNIVTNSSVLGLKNIDASSIVSNTLFFGNGSDYVGSNVDEATTVKANPLYTSTFDLQPGSPAVDAGIVSFVYNSEPVLTIPSSDYNGLTADLGWREFTL